MTGRCPTEIRTAKTKLTGVAVVCARCAKRQGLRPRAVRDLLKAAGKRAAGEAARAGRGRGKLRVVESGCLGPCPKRAVAVATGASLAAGRVVLLDPAAGPAAALAVLLPEFGPNAALEHRPPNWPPVRRETMRHDRETERFPDPGVVDGARAAERPDESSPPD